ncbi:hypothetical protein SDC9_209575 [bioreactor metagenome]|uniref:Uncharacterized protein n=1 Tax=bioreactor metagenome TaxID=1076179 RepID=A0A645JE15_9ZZZZ
MHTAVFGMVSGGEFTLCFRQVERTTVGFGITGNEVDDECNQSGDVSFKDKPSVCLAGYNFRKLHAACEYYHREDGQSDREFITDNLSTASHSSDQ